MPDLTPITREEMLLDGQDLEPITRKEMFIKRIYDKTQVIPEPITREEIFLKKAGDETTDVTIEQLTATENRTYSEEGVAYSPVIVNVPQTTLTTLDVTENGTYTAPSGTAYNEVDVDVPLPENAYLLKDIANTPASIATFTDGSPLPMPKLEVAIEPVQDLHGYDAPWVGGAGKNKLNIDNLGNFSNRGIDFVVAKNSSNAVISVSANGTVTGGTYSDYYIVGASDVYNYANIPSGSYILNGAVSSNAQIYIVSENDGVVVYSNGGDTSAFNIDSSKKYRIFLRISGSVSNVKFYPMIRLATVSDATFVPYSNICPISGWSAVDVTIQDDIDNPTTTETITIQLGDSYYGGKLDVVSGVLTVDRVGVDMGSLDWNNGGAMQMFFSVGIRDLVVKPSSNDEIANVLSDRFEATSYNELSLSTIGKVCIAASGSVGIVDGNTYVSVSDFKTAMNGVQLVYELATPTTIQLTPTQVNSLRGVNNISANSGKIINGQYFSKGE